MLFSLFFYAYVIFSVMPILFYTTHTCIELAFALVLAYVSIVYDLAYDCHCGSCQYSLVVVSWCVQGVLSPSGLISTCSLF